MKTKFFLGIETSCDDTSMAIIKDDNGAHELLALTSFDQTEELKKWGGVVPEIAARNHLQKIPITLKDVFKKAQIKAQDLNCIGVTTHPGLLGPLLTGINCAKTLALLHQKPILSVNHLFAHLEAIQLTHTISYPYIGLLISGGHSLFVLVEASNKMKILASTIDDAAGEAFDKAGKMLGLPYPAGPIIDKYASLGEKKYSFPIGLKSSANANLSFSGLKTALQVFLKDKNQLDETLLYDLCASYQDAIAKALVLKTKYALQNYPKLPLVVGGGVACNSEIRKQLQQKYSNVYFVAPKYCTDNGAMIANYTRINFQDALSFPECLELDGKSKFINKKEFIHG